MGFFYSTDNGQSWNEKSGGLGAGPFGSEAVFSLVISSDYIYAGTRYGVYRENLSEFSGTEIKESYCNTFQIYPNPTSNILNLNFDNILSTDISQIKIYSGLGNEIELPKPMINENNIQLDVSSLPQGVYYISFFNNGKVERARFVKIIDN